MSPKPVVVLDLAGQGNRLRLTAVARPRVVPNDDPHFDVEIEAIGHPFTGTVSELVLRDDLRHFGGDLRRFAPPGQLRFGGDRAAELTLEVKAQQGAQPGAFAIEVQLTPSGDDPRPRLVWLLFDQTAFWTEAANVVDDLLTRS